MKGAMIKILKQRGIRKNSAGIKLEQLKTAEVAKVYDKNIGTDEWIKVWFK